jgi:hypothetical protein
LWIFSVSETLNARLKPAIVGEAAYARQFIQIGGLRLLKAPGRLSRGKRKDEPISPPIVIGTAAISLTAIEPSPAQNPRRFAKMQTMQGVEYRPQ